MRRPGYVLIAALWLMVALSAISLDASLWLRTRAAADTYMIESTAALAASQAGMEQADAMLEFMLREAVPIVQRDPSQRLEIWRVVGPLLSRPDAPYRFRVIFRDVASAVNLTAAPHEELTRFLGALGYDSGRAHELASGIVEQRSMDALDLADLPGIQAADLARIEPHVTSLGDSRININTASVPVLASLDGITVETAAAIVRTREHDGPLASVFVVVDEVSAQSRDELLGAATRLGERLDTEVLQMEVRSAGYTRGGRIGAETIALAARHNVNVVLTSRRFVR